MVDIEDDVFDTVQIEKPSRAERWKRSIAARIRRHLKRDVEIVHQQKVERDALQRLKAKRKLEKDKKRKKRVDVSE